MVGKDIAILKGGDMGRMRGDGRSADARPSRHWGGVDVGAIGLRWSFVGEVKAAIVKEIAGALIVPIAPVANPGPGRGIIAPIRSSGISPISTKSRIFT